ncbi:hypothetical protein [Burkholderia sp. ABCPW 11]|uniref:hypothetical protein n=1 Tax=Burkholderia sp. ABCPW 11 TaxID=1637859 RepID=UPI000ABAF7A9|nr:hypothetical protein [Burkholderia sp. ABCPW 11]
MRRSSCGRPWASASGGGGVEPQTVSEVAALLPQRPEFHVVPHSAHFAFLSPCSEGLARSAPEICTDAKGFDRATFHETLDAKALAFFNANLR